MKLLNLALANSRKNKSAMVSLFVLIIVAALLLNIGLLIVTQTQAFYDQKIKQLKNPHVTFVLKQADDPEKYEELLASDSRVMKAETEKIINLNSAKFSYGDGELSSTVLLFDADAKREIGPITLIEKINTSSPNDIYVPYSFKTSGGYALGDSFSITYQDKKYEHRVAGFFETTLMGTHNFAIIKFLVPESTYKTYLDLQQEDVMLSAILNDQTQASKVKTFIDDRFAQSTEGDASDLLSLDIELVKSVNTLTINMIATLLVAFAIMVVLVSLIVIRFRVSISMEDGMTNIGVLKAIGYTSRQIFGSILLQFISIALFGGVVGVALSYALMPLFGKIISMLSGLIWTQTLDLTVNVLSLSLMVSCVLVVTLLSSLRVRRILPVEAFRGGLYAHNFRRSYFPLEKTRGGLHFLLAIKSALAHAKQNVMVLIIVTALTYASIFSVVLHYNISSDNTAFVDLFGVEPANVYVAVKPDTNTKEILQDIQEMDHVRKVTLLDTIKTKVDGQTVFTNVTDEYEQLENNIVYEGRQPKYDNEISLSWVVSNQLNKGIGDSVEVEFGSEKEKYLITGISQTMTNSGQVAGITLEGIQQLQPDYHGSILNVYLNGISNKDFIKMVQEQHGRQLLETVDINENIESQTSMYTTAIFSVMLMVLAITVLVVGMILFLVTQTIISKRKKELGIMKALGYTTLQLMNQISISFLPIILIGVSLGGVLGYFFTNKMLSVLLSGAGVKRLDFIIHLPSILTLCIGILVLAYVVSMVVSRRIKKISAYGLITE